MKKIIIILGLAILVFTGLLIYEATKIGQKENQNIKYIQVPTCDLQQEFCLFKIPQVGMAKFSIAPRPIKMNTELKLILTGDFKRDIEVWIDFLGMEMDMGYNRVKLVQDDNDYKGDAFLPTCTRDQMTWKSTVLVKKDDELTYGFIFKFVTRKNEK